MSSWDIEHCDMKVPVYIEIEGKNNVVGEFKIHLGDNSTFQLKKMKK